MPSSVGTTTFPLLRSRPSDTMTTPYFLKGISMPNDMAFMHYKRFMETGVCACGEHMDRHVDNYDELKKPGSIACKLLKSDVPSWNAIPMKQPSMGV